MSQCYSLNNDTINECMCDFRLNMAGGTPYLSALLLRSAIISASIICLYFLDSEVPRKFKHFLFRSAL
ncbi:hypothetical protein A359_00530 [secondary endosymbiont of Ctenarytaina eucalypti]|uniref:Uncharacterized protein n=1 Tax=secondary endosymbiont of Ctenarytaina eucalypti TaxID=1199245 RepID=J3YR40_9ENTR|nr:hypothetical protein A359_00530 [secondary endosymbiont of Ctenarytaina eucalypti]